MVIVKHSIKLNKLVLLATVSIVLGLSPKISATDFTTIKIAATPGAIHALLISAKEEFEKTSNAKIEIVEANSSEALRMLENKEVDFAANDSSVNEWMNSSKTSGVILKNYQALKIYHLGKSAFQVYVNKKLDRQEIDGVELKYLLTGNKTQIKNDDDKTYTKIQLLTATSLEGQELTLKHELTNEQNIDYFSKRINFNSVISETEHNVNAMFFGPMNLKLKGLKIKTLKSPLIVRPVYGISAGGEKEELKNFIHLLEEKREIISSYKR
jgi:ABC-type phosphate transport system substrate-binding protein